MMSGAEDVTTSQGSDVTAGDVQEYYGKTLKGTEDLATSACTAPATPMPAFVRRALALVHDEVAARYYGCGLILPEVLEGMSILDLGSGSGRDCYMLAHLVGENGAVTGIDMTDEQLAVANKFHEYHREKFGYSKANTRFVKGYIEKLVDAGLAPNSFDIIVSNCVVNLSTDKRAVLSEAYKVLKEGGELYFSDIYADRRLSDEIRKHKLLWGECISGALYWQDLFTLAAEIGFTTPRLVTGNIVEIEKPDLKAAVQGAEFVSVTYRLFKLPPTATKEAREVIYEGDIRGAEDQLKFDHKYTFKKEDMTVVDGETAAILNSSRFSEYFSTGAKKPACCPNPDKASWLDPFEFVRSTDAPKSCCAPGACC